MARLTVNLSMRRTAIWIVWLIVALALTAQPFLWHVEQFRNLGPLPFAAFLIAGALLVLATPVYARLRRRWLGWEPLVFLVTPPILVGIHDPRALLAVATVPPAVLGLGLLIVRCVRIESGGGVPGLLVPMALGLGAMMALLLPLGLAGALWLWPLLLLPLVYLVRMRRRVIDSWRTSVEAWTTDESLRGALAGLCVPWLFILEVLTVLTVLAPSRVWDVLRNHLFLAQYYLEKGALAPIAGLDYSYFPQGVELFMSMGLALAGQAGAQIIPALFFPVLMGAGWCIARECGASRAAALVGIAAAATMPALHWTGSVAKNDAATAAFLLVALYAYLRFLNTRDFRVVLAGAFLLSMAFHVKHVAIFGAVPLALLYLHAVWLTPRRIRSLALLAMIALAVAPAYQLRAWRLVGNPFFPYSVGGIVEGSVRDYSTSRRSPTRLFTVPGRVLFDGRAGWEYTSTSNNPVGMFPLLFLPLVFIGRGSSRKWWAVLFFALLHYAFWALMLVVIRYFIAVLAVLAVFYADRIFNFWNSGGRLVRTTVSFALLYAFLFGLCGTLLVEANAPFLAYFMRRINREQYLTEVVPDYGSLAQALRLSSPGDRIFGVGNCAAAYAGGPARFDCLPCNRFDGGGACSVDDARPALERAQARFIIVRDRPDLAPVSEYVMKQMRGREVYRDRYCIVLEAGARPR